MAFLETASQGEKAAALKRQLTNNLLTIAKEFVGQPDKASLFPAMPPRRPPRPTLRTTARAVT